MNRPLIDDHILHSLYELESNIISLSFAMPESTWKDRKWSTHRRYWMKSEDMEYGVMMSCQWTVILLLNFIDIWLKFCDWLVIHCWCFWDRTWLVNDETKFLFDKGFLGTKRIFFCAVNYSLLGNYPLYLWFKLVWLSTINFAVNHRPICLSARLQVSLCFPGMVMKFNEWMDV